MSSSVLRADKNTHLDRTADLAAVRCGHAVACGPASDKLKVAGTVTGSSSKEPVGGFVRVGSQYIKQGNKQGCSSAADCSNVSQRLHDTDSRGTLSARQAGLGRAC